MQSCVVPILCISACSPLSWCVCCYVILSCVLGGIEIKHVSLRSVKEHWYALCSVCICKPLRKPFYKYLLWLFTVPCLKCDFVVRVVQWQCREVCVPEIHPTRLDFVCASMHSALHCSRFYDRFLMHPFWDEVCNIWTFNNEWEAHNVSELKFKNSSRMQVNTARFQIYYLL